MIQRLKARLAALEAQQGSTTLIVRLRQFGEPISDDGAVSPRLPDRVIYVTTNVPSSQAALE
jgi:hypothetical protein